MLNPPYRLGVTSRISTDQLPGFIQERIDLRDQDPQSRGSLSPKMLDNSSLAVPSPAAASRRRGAKGTRRHIVQGNHLRRPRAALPMPSPHTPMVAPQSTDVVVDEPYLLGF